MPSGWTLRPPADRTSTPEPDPLTFSLPALAPSSMPPTPAENLPVVCSMLLHRGKEAGGRLWAG